MQHQSTAVLVRTNSFPAVQCCSAIEANSMLVSLQFAFIQVCSDPTPVHCKTFFCRMHFPLLSAALQDRLAAGLNHCDDTHAGCSSYRCAVTQHQCNATLFFARCSPHCSVLLCKTGLQQACITVISPMKVCRSYRSAVTQHQCTTTLPACCEPVLQSSTEQWGLHFALNRAAVHWCRVTAHLYEWQNSMGVFAVACCLL